MNRSRDKLCAFCQPFVNKCVREALVSFEHETGCFSYLETSARDGCPLCGVIMACIVDGKTLTPLHLRRKDLSPIKLSVSLDSLDISVDSASGTELGVVSVKTLRDPPESFIEDDVLGDPYLLQKALEDKTTSPFRISTNFRTIDEVFDERKYKGRRQMYCVERNGADMPRKICDLATEAGQQEMAGLVTQRLETCWAHHEQCAGPQDQNLVLPLLPTRVLDVGTPECPYLRLHVPEDGERKEYTCLSYCWGTGVPQFGTTKATLDDLRKQIPFQQLPKTVQDAIVFTRRLRTRYLWVDALCVIQDDTSDPSDWQREVARFGTYYQNALCTLSATGSYDSSEGLFLPSWDRIYPTYFCMLLNRGSQEPLYYTRLPSVHDPCSLISKTPLSMRGWPAQEKLLSPRIVHFTRRYVVWECFEHIASERDPEGDMTTGLEEDVDILPGFSKWWMPHLVGDQHPMSAWSTLCDWYMKQKFSRRSDRLPALSGVVQRLQEDTKNQFYAGLWEGNIVLGLDWWVMDPESMLNTQALFAPSWSWVHATGKLRLEHMSWESIFSTDAHASTTTSAIEPRILSIKVRETSHGIDGSTTSGTIAMSGILSTLNLGELRYKQDSGTSNRWMMDGDLPMVAIHWDRLPLEVDPHDTYVCLRLSESKESWKERREQEVIKALVLVLVSNDENGTPEYRRVGRGTFWQDIWDGGKPEWKYMKPV